jgi:hypothetical protein
MKSTIQEGATKESMAAQAQTLGADQKGDGFKCDPGDCTQRGWIINGCYWCGYDCCVNPGWLSAQCYNCGGWFLVSR